MSISIITRAYKTSELKNLLLNLNSNTETEFEVIAVCNVKDCETHEIKLVIEDSNRFEARISGIRHANYDKVLLLDSDQIIENGLLAELDNRSEDIIIIPERSVNKTLTSVCLDDWRSRYENYARTHVSPYVPVVPRFYRKRFLINAIKKLSPNVYAVISHEDSVLYYEVFKETQNIGFSKKYIYNFDPSFFALMKKASLYGKNSREVESLALPAEILHLIDSLNKNALNLKELKFGKGFVMQILRGCAYELGRLVLAGR